MNLIKCLIVDDEELARNLVENYVKRLPNLELVAKCANPIEAIQVLQDHQVDLIFLDIQMPELTGMEFLKTLTQKPMVIFTTAYKEYALESYELDAVDYLLKPFRFERFLQAVNKVGSILQTKTTPAPQMEVQTTSEQVKDYILVKSNFKVFRLHLDDIVFIESMKEYVAYHTKEERILSLGSLKQLQVELPSTQFIRIHKSYIANISYITTLEGNMIHIDHKKLPIGTSYKEEVMKRVF